MIKRAVFPPVVENQLMAEFFAAAASGKRREIAGCGGDGNHCCMKTLQRGRGHG
jgi:hypothetical protein